MIIKDKIVLVYDIEVFPNCFHCCVKNTETKEILLFECSHRKNNVQELIELFDNKDYIFCGYNNIHYDNPIINLLRKYRKKNKTINSIDLKGGHIIRVGGTIQEKKEKSIKEQYVIKFE